MFVEGTAFYCPNLNIRSSVGEITQDYYRLLKGGDGEEDKFTLSGITLIEDFLTEKEEEDIVDKIEATDWALSQSGRRKQVRYSNNLLHHSFRIMGPGSISIRRRLSVIGLSEFQTTQILFSTGSSPLMLKSLETTTLLNCAISNTRLTDSLISTSIKMM